jgi:uncharacterized integral membrane protein
MSEVPPDRPVPTDQPATEPAPPSDSRTSEPIRSAPPAPARNPLRRTRTGGTWVGIIIFTVVLVLLLIFILQNTRSVPIHYFTVTGHLPLAVAMLLAAVAGVALAAIAGSLRIWQLRRRLRDSVRQ